METTVTISDLNAGTYTFTNTTGELVSITYITPEFTLTN
jgi:hypothetical protein